MDREAVFVIFSKACEILAVPEKVTKTELKKRYRELMHNVHPDARVNNSSDCVEACSYEYSAYEINEAYSVICNHMKENADITSDRNVSGNKYQYTDYMYPEDELKEEYREYGWDAPVNENAYCNRSIYHYAETYDGDKIGYFRGACGKYLWTVEEDFGLFIKSIFECSEELLNNVDKRKNNSSGIDNNRRFVVQKELAYLLAQQFIAATDTLDSILTSLDEDNSRIYYITAMLEMLDNAPYIRAGMKLYPSRINRHRLYLKTQAGVEAGYVSLKDDRLYYILIPILEQRRAQVKTVVSLKQEKNSRKYLQKYSGKYKNLDFWIKLNDNDKILFPENINMQIDGLLKRYKEDE